jgi:hypothetical protein
VKWSVELAVERCPRKAVVPGYREFFSLKFTRLIEFGMVEDTTMMYSINPVKRCKCYLFKQL